ncbi:MAG: helix-turn-helix transcriptional regulator [Nitrospirales bacterium]
MVLKLKLLRMERDFTQWDISHASAISQGRYSMIERGLIEPTPEERERLAQVLRAPAATLLKPACRAKRAHGPASSCVASEI